MFPWKDALYALYNINFQLLPPCLSELDVNWPQSNIRTGRAQTLPNPVATPTLPDYNIEEDKGTEVKITFFSILSSQGLIYDLKKFKIGFERVLELARHRFQNEK